jgi:hypothetical protein
MRVESACHPRLRLEIGVDRRIEEVVVVLELEDDSTSERLASVSDTGSYDGEGKELSTSTLEVLRGEKEMVVVEVESVEADHAEDIGPLRSG